MGRILRTTRRLPRETAELEQFIGVDGQGAPQYAEAVEISVHVVEGGGDNVAGDRYHITPEGTRIRITRLLYVMGDASPVPARRDRIRLAEGAFIVVDRQSFRGLKYSRSEIDHYRIECTDE